MTICGFIMIQKQQVIACPNYKTIVEGIGDFHDGLKELHTTTMNSIGEVGKIIGITLACLLALGIGYKLLKYRNKRRQLTQSPGTAN